MKNNKSQISTIKKPKKKKQGFTLVELIVVITILAILGTIAFISLQGYSKNARDGQRISDINNIRKNLELFYTEKGIYPIPDNGINITYSGATVWTQGTIGDNVIKNLQKLNKKPVDPLTGNEYTYSITQLKSEYQIGAIQEAGGIAYNTIKIINQANAAELKKISAYVVGTYNEKIIKLSTGATDYILAVPSIINGDITKVDLVEILNNKTLVYNNYSNLPDSYKNKGYSMTGGFDFTPNTIVVYTGALTTLKEDTNKLILMDNLKQTYDNTILENETTYKDIINSNTTTDSTGAILLTNNYIDTFISPGLIPKDELSQIQTPTLSPYTCTSTGQIYYTDSNLNKLASVTNTGVATWETGKIITDLTCAGHIVVCIGPNNPYILQTCNLGSATVGTGASSYGNYYQWGRNKGFPNGDISQQSTTIAGTIGLNAGTDTYGFVWNAGLPSPYTWANTDINNNWGGSGTTTTQTYWDISAPNKTLMQGPCSNGYHIPTQKEWSQIYTSGGWGSNGTNMKNTLNLPGAGYRYWSDGSMYYQGTSGIYWASSPGGTYGGSLLFGSGYVITSYYPNRAGGFTLRCIKN